MNSVRREKGVSKMSPHSCLGNDRGVNTWLAGRDCPRPFLAILSLPVPLRCSLGCTGSAAAMSSQEEGVCVGGLACFTQQPTSEIIVSEDPG